MVVSLTYNYNNRVGYDNLLIIARVEDHIACSLKVITDQLISSIT